MRTTLFALTITAMLAQAVSAESRLPRTSDSDDAVITFAVHAAANFDPDGDDIVTFGDVAYLVTYLFEDGPEPIGSGDANGDGVVDPADIFYVVNYLLDGGPPPA